MNNLIGQFLGRYHILEQLGEGGMATVYKGFDTQLERFVAVKVILPFQNKSERTIRRFQREARALAKLNHPNIVRLLDYGEHGDLPYLVMEYIPGEMLKQKMDRPMAWQTAAQLLIPVARALEYAHQHGIIHRDVKPSNILLSESGEPMLLDFGVAKTLQSEETFDLTGTGVGVGTPEYMAPEQGVSKTTDHRVDIYSLGTIFYELVTGRKPYEADTPLAVILKRSNTSLPRPKQFAPSLPNRVEQVILKALAKDPKDRFGTAAEMADALENLKVDSPALKSSEKRSKFDSDLKPEEKVSKPNAKVPRTIPKWGWSLMFVMLGVLLIGWAYRWIDSLELEQLILARISNATVAPVTVSVPLASATSGNPPFPTPLFTSPTKPLPTKITDDKGVQMELVPAENFMMGSNDGSKDEKPVHVVYLDSYYIDIYEVTTGLYRACVNAGACQQPQDTGRYKYSYFDDHPVVWVNWFMAKAYCEWRGAQLPTEAQWEKAARGVDGRIYPWGADIKATYANYAGVNTAAIGSYIKDKSPYGIYDMGGNVSEWVGDWYSDAYYQTSPSSNPLGPNSGQYRVLRGGSWYDNSLGVRSDRRGWNFPTNSHDNIGFRCSRMP